MASRFWIVTLNGKVTDKVPYENSYKTAAEVKKSLVNHDGYDAGIEVYLEPDKTVHVEDNIVYWFKDGTPESDLLSVSLYDNGGFIPEEGEPAELADSEYERITRLLKGERPHVFPISFDVVYEDLGERRVIGRHSVRDTAEEAAVMETYRKRYDDKVAQENRNDSTGSTPVSKPEHKMWASDREMIRLAANNLDGWVNELSSPEDAKVNEIGEMLRDVVSKLRHLHANSRSEEVPPADL